MIFNFFKKTKVAVIMGGPSSEHEVSLWSGKMVVKHLNKKKYKVEPIIVSKENKWPIQPKDLAKNYDVAFIAMHGEYGEDGKLQTILEKYKMPYTGSNAKVSKLAMDKVKSLKLLSKKKLNCPPFVTLKNLRGVAKLGLPLVVKPIDLGSSVGVTIVKTMGDFAPAVSNALNYSKYVMIQKYIKGKELTCGVLEQNGKTEALPPTEIIPKGKKFFDYKAKYTSGGSLEITPPKLPEEIIKNIQKTALAAHKMLGCSGYSRVDFILDKDDKLHVLEVNTLPGLTKTSLFPQAAKKSGFAFHQLLDVIIDNTLKNG